MTIYIFAPPTGRLSTLVKELTATYRIIQSSSNEEITPVSNRVKCKQTKFHINALNSRADDGRRIGLTVSYRSKPERDVDFDPSLKRPAYLTSLKCCDTTTVTVEGAHPAFSFLRGPGACSGLRSGAWPWKRNNGRLGAFN